MGLPPPLPMVMMPVTAKCSVGPGSYWLAPPTPLHVPGRVTGPACRTSRCELIPMRYVDGGVVDNLTWGEDGHADASFPDSTGCHPRARCIRLGAREIHSGGLDHLDAGLRSLRANPPAVQG